MSVRVRAAPVPVEEQRSPPVLDLVSGRHWRTHAASPPIAGWNGIDFDDSTWTSAWAPHPYDGPTAEVLIPGSRAGLAWHPDRPIEAYFRHVFELRYPVDRLPPVGYARSYADDDAALWVNGELVLVDDSGVANADVCPPFPDGRPRPVDTVSMAST